MQELDKILEEINAEFDRRIRTQLKIIAGLGDDVYRYGYGKSLEAYQQGKLFVTDIIRKHMNNGWIPVEERSPAGYERIGYDKIGNKYMRRLEIAYMTDTIEYVHGYYDGYKWMDKWYDIIENVVAWKIHKPYRPERRIKNA